jgi:hypothetical protein
LSTTNGSVTIKTAAFGGLLNLQSGTTSDNWLLYHYSLDNTLRFNYNGAGADEFIMTSTGAATFSSSVTVNGALYVGQTGVTNGIINSNDGMYFNIDADASGSTPEFMFGKGRSGAGSGGTTFMTITNGGNVGIGNTAPLAKIQTEVGNTTSVGLYSASGLAITSSGGSTGNVYQISFGYGGGGATYGSSAIYGITESSAGYNTGALGFATRSATTDTAPTERMRIFSDGNVFIGLSPSNAGFKLDVNGTVNFISGTNDTTYLRVGNNSARQLLFSNFTNGSRLNSGHRLNASDSSGAIILATAGTDRLTIASTGAATFSSSVTATGMTIVGFSSASGLILNYGNASGQIEAINFRANGGANGVIGMQMVSAGVGDLWLGSSSGRVLTLYRDGNVGIGNISPLTKLTVNNAVSGAILPYINGTGLSYNNDGISVAGSNTNNTNIGNGITFYNNVASVGAYGPVISWSSMTAGGAYNATYAFITGVYRGAGGDSNWSTGDIIFGTGNSYGASERMRITSGGNVGIGNTLPSGRFHVTSTGITASSPSLGWPVYNAEQDANARLIYVDTEGNGNVSTAGSGATVVVQLGQYFDSRVVITPPGAGSAGPSDQGTGSGKDLMLKAGTSDNGIGLKGGRLYLNGGMGFGGSFNTNGGDILMQSLTGSGNVGIGKTPSSSRKLDVNGFIEAQRFYSSTNYLAFFPNYGNTVTWEIGSDIAYPGMYFYNASGGYVFRMTVAGSATFVGGVTSDIRTKQNIQVINNNAIEFIKELNPVSYEFIGDVVKKTRRGFIAQEVLQTSIPNLVLGDGDQPGGTYGLDYDGILALAVKAIQELKAENDLLRQDVNLLKNK